MQFLRRIFRRILLGPVSWKDMPESSRRSIMSKNLTKRKELAFARANSNLAESALTSSNNLGGGADSGADAGIAAYNVLSDERRLERQQAMREGERSGK